MKSWTIDEMLEEGPCDEYTRERLDELWAGKERLTLLEILHLPISNEDKVWAAARNHEHRAAWLECVVTRAVTDHASHCGVEEVEAWAARWVSGEDRTYSAADAAANAADVAWAAADDARAADAAANAADAAANAADVAWAAAWAATDVAWAAAWPSVRAATDVAWAAADDAAWAAADDARAAERKQQVADMMAVLQEEVEV